MCKDVANVCVVTRIVNCQFDISSFDYVKWWKYIHDLLVVDSVLRNCWVMVLGSN